MTNVIAHILGYPRIGIDREMKKAVETYWRGEITQNELEAVGKQIRHDNWKAQAEAGLDYVTVGDFSWYDHVLDTSAMLGVIPERFGSARGNVHLNTIFCMARGKAPQVKDAQACEMTKWFNTNYHYIVPEFIEDQAFHLATDSLLTAIAEANALGYRAKPVILGPLTYLWLGKTKHGSFNKLNLLKKLLPVYNQIFQLLKQKNIQWVQIDEPILSLDLPLDWQTAFVQVYQKLAFKPLNLMLTAYFGALSDNLAIIKQLPVQGLHVDLCSAPEQLDEVITHLPKDCILSLGLINGRNIWRTDLQQTLATIKHAQSKLQHAPWISSSCSLLHTPVDLSKEMHLDAELKTWLAFAKQKVDEIALLKQAINEDEASVTKALAENQHALQTRRQSPRIHNKQVETRIKELTKNSAQRSNHYNIRAKTQHEILKLPLLPTTTIGSFPQTTEIRSIRHEYKAGKMDAATYTKKIQAQIAAVIAKQEALKIDVLVHGEAERNDMVEYFGELLQGFAFTDNGWVQSYGSRCVKPPIIYGDISRPAPMTVEWAKYAQSLSKRPVKGMLTGPVTILSWSFARDDLTAAQTALQIALALRDEVNDLEAAGINVIQIDEPAFREALPLRKKDWQHYLDWSVHSFRIASCGVKDQTQIHTHMCYSEFNDMIEAIANLDADVITLESSRSQMELLQVFERFSYPNEIGPGVYDIHSPRIPTTEEIVAQLEKALEFIPVSRLWVNPDCGLKTRHWPETEQSLKNMIAAAQILREKYKSKQGKKEHAV